LRLRDVWREPKNITVRLGRNDAELLASQRFQARLAERFSPKPGSFGLARLRT